MEESSSESSDASGSGDVVIVSPRPYDVVKSPLIVRGKALNNWFFEGSVPVMLIDSHGTVLVQGPGSALTDWMQPGWVEFKADLVWSGMPASSDGELVIKRDNPSGLPENDASVRIPVRF